MPAKPKKYIVVQSIKTSQGDDKVLKKIGHQLANGNIDPFIYEDLELALYAAECVQSGHVIELKNFKHYISSEELKKISLGQDFSS